VTFSSGFFAGIVVVALVIAAIAAVVLPILLFRDARGRRLW